MKHKNPKITCVDDVQFFAPVEIGTSVDFESKIGYVTGKFVHVIISCKNLKGNEDLVLTNILRVTFEHDLNENEVAKVYPDTLQ